MKNMQTAKIPASGKRPLAKQPNATKEAPRPKHLRRLKWNEVVVSGDYIVNEERGFEPWEGPGGFRADSFLKPIYRQEMRSVRS